MVSVDSPGRRRATSRQLLEEAALALFGQRGFDATTVDDIAAAAGVSRRSFFRYYASKNDVVWGDFEAGLAEMEAGFTAVPHGVDMWSAISQAVISFNSLPPAAVESHRQRMTLILHVPALQAHSTLRYAEWRAVISRFAASRLGTSETSMAAQLVGHVSLAAAVAAYEEWLNVEFADIGDLLRQTYAALDANWPRSLSLGIPGRSGRSV